MSWDPRNFGASPANRPSVGSQLAVSHGHGRNNAPPPPVPAAQIPCPPAEPGTSIAQQVEAAQVALHQAAQVYFGSHPATDRGNLSQRAAAILQSELGRAATEEAPAFIRAHVLEPAQAAFDSVASAAHRDGDTAQELRNGRFWDATKAELDGKAPGELVGAAQRLLENTSGDQLSVVVEQLPSYLQAHGVDTAFVRPVLASRPEFAEAAEQLKAANKVAAIVQSNADMLKRAIKSGHVPPTLVGTAPFDIAATAAAQ